MLDELLNEVKDYLKIYSSREDERIKKMIQGGKMFLEGLTSSELDFQTNHFARELLLDYCRYRYNGALEFFGKNFKSELLRLQLSETAKAFGGGE